MRRAWQVTRLVLLPTIVLGVALAIAPQRATLEVHVWLLVVLALALHVSLAVVHAAYARTPSPFVASLRRPPAPAEHRPDALLRLERVMSMAGSTAFDVHFRLRPTITALASELLSSRRGIDLDHEPDRARAALGEDVWDLVRPDRPQPSEPHDTGMGEDALDSVVTTLEHI